MLIRRNARAPLTILVLFTLLIGLGGFARAAVRGTGPGCALGPDDAINNAAANDIYTPLYEEEFGRNTNDAVIRVSMEIEGGWSAPNFDCGGNNSGIFSSRAEMLAAGLLYNPANRSSLNNFDSPVLRLDSGVKSLAIRSLNMLTSQQISGNGGGLRVVGGDPSPRLNGASLLIDNSAFRPNFFITDPTGAQGDGGGLFLDLDGGSSLTIRDSLFKDQTAGGKGGGFAITVRGGSRVTIERTLVQGNRANSCGGGVISIYSGTVTLRDSTFENNGSDAAVPDLCIERPAGSTGSATVYLLRSQFSQDGLRIDPGITVFTSQAFLPALSK